MKILKVFKIICYVFDFSHGPSAYLFLEDFSHISLLTITHVRFEGPHQTFVAYSSRENDSQNNNRIGGNMQRGRGGGHRMQHGPELEEISGFASVCHFLIFQTYCYFKSVGVQR